MSQAKKIGITGASAAVIAAACVFIQPWEGLWTAAKIDTLGTGRPLTWCYGETIGNAKLGDKFTPKQCSDMLARRLPEYANAIAPCIKVPISDKEYVAYTSTSYNIGVAGFCRSTTVKRLNHGDHRGACAALMNWVYAQGKFVQGLWNRRDAERKLCLEGVNELAVHRFASIPQKAPGLSAWQKMKLAFNYITKG